MVTLDLSVGQEAYRA